MNRKFQALHVNENLTEGKCQQDAGNDQERLPENRIGRSKDRGFDP
jgi:hypothetical protein